MQIKDYQFLHSLDSGSTSYETDLIDYFKINRNQSYDKVIEELNLKLFIKNNEFTGDSIKVGKKVFKVEKDFLECNYEQFVRLEMLLAEENNIHNLHKLLAVYFRPRKFNYLKLRWDIEFFDLKKQDEISEYIKENMDVDDAQSLLVFFYQLGIKCFRNMNIYYLNQMKIKDLI